jgi:hypothetical protein
VPKPRLAAPAMTVLVVSAFAVIVGAIVAVIAVAAFTNGGVSGSAGSPVPISDNRTASDNAPARAQDPPTPTLSPHPAPTRQPTTSPVVTPKPAPTSTSVRPTRSPKPHRSCGWARTCSWTAETEPLRSNADGSVWACRGLAAGQLRGGPR